MFITCLLFFALYDILWLFLLYLIIIIISTQFSLLYTVGPLWIAVFILYKNEGVTLLK